MVFQLGKNFLFRKFVGIFYFFTKMQIFVEIVCIMHRRTQACTRLYIYTHTYTHTRIYTVHYTYK